MASTPVTPAAPAASATPTVLQNWIALFKAHEKFLTIALVLAFLFHFYSKGIDAFIGHESTKAQAAAVVVKTDDAATKDLTNQLADLKAQVATQTFAIAKDIQQRNQATTKQQAIDKTLAPPALATRWLQQLKLTSGIDPTTGQQFAVSQDAAVSTVVALEEIPALTANVAALQTELNNDTTIINKQQDLIGKLNTDLTDEKKSHVADVNLEKAKAKRSFLRGFKVGAVAGFVGGLFIGHKI